MHEESLENFAEKISTKEHTIKVHTASDQDGTYNININSLPTLYWKFASIHASFDIKNLNLLSKINEDQFIDLIKKYPKLLLGSFTPSNIIINTITLSNLSLLKLLLKYGANPNLKDRWEITPLGHTIKQQDYRLTELLLKHGADVNKVNVERFK